MFLAAGPLPPGIPPPSRGGTTPPQKAGPGTNLAPRPPRGAGCAGPATPGGTRAASAGGFWYVSGGGPLPSGHPAAEPWGHNPTAEDGPENDLARRAARVVELRLAGILGEIQSGLAYWMHQSDRPLSRIVLAGGGARAGDIAGRL